MSTATVQRSLAEAIAEAEAFRNLFLPACYRQWEVAGSVRRRRAQVGDVEHVVLPAWGDVDVAGDLFARKEFVNLLWYRLDELVRTGAVAKHVYGGVKGDGVSRTNPPEGYVRTSFRWGQAMRGVNFRGFRHELYTAEPDNWGAQLAIRTGPAEFSHRLVLKLQFNGFMNSGGFVWDKNDWVCGDCQWYGTTPDRVPGELVGGFVSDPDGRDGGPWTDVCPRCRGHRRLVPKKLSVTSERQYLELCGMGWVPPERRI